MEQRKEELDQMNANNITAIAELIFMKIKDFGKEPRIVVFIGAGVSTSSGISTSRDLKNELVAEYSREFQKMVDTTLFRVFRKNFDESTFEMVCSIVAKFHGIDAVTKQLPAGSR